jgi:hypothetical protein
VEDASTERLSERCGIFRDEEGKVARGVDHRDGGGLLDTVGGHRGLLGIEEHGEDDVSLVDEVPDRLRPLALGSPLSTLTATMARSFVPHRS